MLCEHEKFLLSQSEKLWVPSCALCLGWGQLFPSPVFSPTSILFSWYSCSNVEFIPASGNTVWLLPFFWADVRPISGCGRHVTSRFVLKLQAESIGKTEILLTALNIHFWHWVVDGDWALCLQAMDARALKNLCCYLEQGSGNPGAKFGLCLATVLPVAPTLPANLLLPARKWVSVKQTPPSPNVLTRKIDNYSFKTFYYCILIFWPWRLWPAP